MKTITLFCITILLSCCNSIYSQSHKKIYDRLLSIKEKISESTYKTQKSLDSLKPSLNKENIDSLWGLYYRTQSTILSNQLEKEKALESLNRSVTYYQKAKNSKGIALSVMNKGVIYLYQGNTKQSLSQFTKALEIAQHNNLKYVSGLLYQNIGVLYLNNGKIDEALKYATKAYDVFKQLDKEKEMAMMLTNIGNTYYEKYETDKALKYYQQSMAISENLKDSVNIAKLLNNIGAVYIDDKKDMKTGLVYLLKSLEIKKRLNDQNGIIFQYNNIATYLASVNDFSSSESYLEKAFALATKGDDKNGLKDVYATYSKIYEKKEDFKNSLKYYKLYSGVKDSLLNKENTAILNDLKIKYETAEKDSEIIAQKSKILKRNILALVLIGLLLLGFIYYKNYKNRQKIRLQSEILYQQDLSTKAVMNAEDQERKRMALHLHDGIGTLLSAINMNVNVLEDFRNDEQQFRKIITKTKAILDDAINDVRDLSHQIMPNMLIKNSLSNALRDLIEKTNSPTLAVNLIMEGMNDAVDQNRQVVIYRIIQECINNIIRHAYATTVHISIVQTNDIINIQINDDGKGFDPLAVESRSDGMGLENIKSRIEFLKGELFVKSSSEHGSEINVTMPLV